MGQASLHALPEKGTVIRLLPPAPDSPFGSAGMMVVVFDRPTRLARILCIATFPFILCCSCLFMSALREEIEETLEIPPGGVPSHYTLTDEAARTLAEMNGMTIEEYYRGSGSGAGRDHANLARGSGSVVDLSAVQRASRQESRASSAGGRGAGGRRESWVSARLSAQDGSSDSRSLLRRDPSSPPLRPARNVSGSPRKMSRPIRRISHSQDALPSIHETTGGITEGLGLGDSAHHQRSGRWNSFGHPGLRVHRHDNHPQSLANQHRQHHHQHQELQQHPQHQQYQHERDHPQRPPRQQRSKSASQYELARAPIPGQMHHAAHPGLSTGDGIDDHRARDRLGHSGPLDDVKPARGSQEQQSRHLLVPGDSAMPFQRASSVSSLTSQSNIDQERSRSPTMLSRDGSNRSFGETRPHKRKPADIIVPESHSLNGAIIPIPAKDNGVPRADNHRREHPRSDQSNPRGNKGAAAKIAPATEHGSTRAAW